MLSLDHFKKGVSVIENAQNELSELFGRQVKLNMNFVEGKLTPDLIAMVVSSCCNVSYVDLFTDKKSDPLVFARYHSYYLMYRLLNMNKSEIGRYFDKNHSTVINGLNQFDAMYETSKSFKQQSQFIEKSILKAVSSNENSI